MTLFTDNPFEKMMIQRPGGGVTMRLPVPHSPACASCPYKGSSLCGLLSETGTGEKGK